MAGELLQLCIIFLLYCSLQLKRNNDIYKIRRKWIKQNDSRFDHYEYEEMFGNLTLRMWFGLRTPKDELYIKRGKQWKQ